MKLLAALLLLSGCYLEHEADVLPDSSTVERPTVNREDAGSSHYGCTRPGDAYWRKYCEGPYANCIAPGSPQSSTWGQR